MEIYWDIIRKSSEYMTRRKAEKHIEKTLGKTDPIRNKKSRLNTIEPGFFLSQYYQKQEFSAHTFALPACDISPAAGFYIIRSGRGVSPFFRRRGYGTLPGSCRISF